MFLDEVKIFVAAGGGGNGSQAMRREKFVPLGGPFGGNGGRGGDVVLRASHHANTLSSYYRKRHFRAESGGHGSTNNRSGRYGKGLVLDVPVGTVVKDEQTGNVLADLAAEGDTFAVARGGRGGRGNIALTREHALARYAEKGEAGEERWVVMELKLLADVGLVGFPNAGKSTLLSRISAARPKIADYPFTTLSPHLGVVRSGSDSAFVVADIPGLVEGAHEGKGMGDRFLKHVERTRLVLHLVDVSGWEGRDPVEDWKAINRELSSWHPLLAAKRQLLVPSKMDVPESKEHLKRLQEAAGTEAFPISSVTGEGLDALINEVARLLPELPVPELHRDAIVTGLPPRREVPLVVERCDDGSIVVRGTRVERLVARTFLENEYAVENLQNKLYQMGVEELLASAGAAAGDLVRIGKFEFTYYPDEVDS